MFMANSLLGIPTNSKRWLGALKLGQIVQQLIGELIRVREVS